MADDHGISAADLHAVLSYCPDTGALTWRRHHWQALIGSPVTFDSERGYQRFRIGRKWLRAHRVAWALMTGEWPHMVDHINGNRADNRWCNLRATDAFLNQQNRIMPERGNKAGLLGVVVDGGRFIAKIRVRNESITLGRFKTKDEAHAAYIKAKTSLHPHAHLSQSSPATPHNFPTADFFIGKMINVGGTRL